MATTKPVIYTRPDDPVTERIVSEFDDFGGFSDGGPVNPRPRRARGSNEPFGPADETLSSEIIDSVPSTEEPKSLLLCPSCGVELPHPTHLVSNAMLASLSLAQSTLPLGGEPFEQIVDVKLPKENSPL